MGKIVTLGPQGSNCSIVAEPLSRSLDAKISFENKMEGIINSVKDTRSGLIAGVLPISNKYGGLVYENLKGIHDNKDFLDVIGITSLNIAHCLACENGEDNIEDITKVYSHPQALTQCKNFLNMIGIQQVETNSTSNMVGKLKPSEAIICSDVCAIDNNMNIISNTIAPNDNNTNFAIISNKIMGLDQSDIDPELLDIYKALFLFGDPSGLFHMLLRTTPNEVFVNQHFSTSFANGKGGYDHLGLFEGNDLEIMSILREYYKI